MTLIHKSELKTYRTLINRVIKEYELRLGTTRTQECWLSQNQILKLTQNPTIESQLHSNTLCMLQQDTKFSGL